MTKTAWAVGFLLSATAFAEPIQLLKLDGKKVSLESVQRDATLVAFWMVDCVPCVEEMAQLSALAQKLKDDARVTIIGVNLDEEERAAEVKKLVTEKKPAYLQLRDPRYHLVSQWFPEKPGELGVPTLVAFDRQLRALTKTGFNPGSSADDFIAAWTPRLERVKAGQLTEKLEKVKGSGKAKQDPQAMSKMIEAMLRQKHPEWKDAEIKKRRDAALDDIKQGRAFTIE